MKFAKLSPVWFVIVSMLAVSSFGLSAAKTQNRTGMDKRIIAQHEDGATFNDRQVDTKSIEQGDTVLIAQAPALWCYTNYGRYPMVVAVPPGAACQINVAFYPYVLYGIAGHSVILRTT